MRKTKEQSHEQADQLTTEHRQNRAACLHRRDHQGPAYDGIGIRTYRTPTRTYNFNPIVGNKDLERDVKTALKDSGLEVYDLYSFYLQPEMDWNTVTPALEFGGEIGCKYVLSIGDDPEWNRMVDTMGRMVDLLTPLGMKAVFESHASQAVGACAGLTPITSASISSTPASRSTSASAPTLASSTATRRASTR